MLGDFMGDYGSRFVVAIVGVGLALFCLLGILWIMRGRRGPSPFLRGGRNRQPRLQVLDAAAVDARRRLVLVRRDDVEHLIMIGGPTDVVIESRIHVATPKETRAAEVTEPAPAAVKAELETAAAFPSAPRPAVAAQPQRPAPQPTQPQTAQKVEPAQKAEPTIAPVAPAAREPRPAPAQQIPAFTPPVPAGPTARIPAPVPRTEPELVAVPVARAALPVAPQLPVAPTVAAANRQPDPVATPTGLDDAAKLLDTARDRVFAERPVAAPSMPVPAPPRPAAPSAEPGRALGSDFERILEEEMASNLAARETAQSVRPAVPVNTQPAPAVAAVPVKDPSLQDEVARIFGEMSASRDR